MDINLLNAKKSYVLFDTEEKLKDHSLLRSIAIDPLHIGTVFFIYLAWICDIALISCV